jgi:hypothetical protein
MTVKRVMILVFAALVLLAQTAAFASSAELGDVRRPVDAWLYSEY